MDKLFKKEKELDPGFNLDSEDSDSDMPNNSKLSLRNGDIPPALSLIHNELQEELEFDTGHWESLDASSGPQAANPKGKKTTTCNGGKPSPGYQAKCDQTASGGKEFKVYTADANTWGCRVKHEGLCWNCYNAPTCPVCGNTKPRLSSHGK